VAVAFPLAVPEQPPFLVVAAPEGRELVVELAGERERLVVGRAAASDIALGWDVQVSRAHAELVRSGGEWTIVDDGLSRNGTWVNGERLSGRRRLTDGDVLRVGATSLTFHAIGAEAGAPAGTVDAGQSAPGDTLTPSQRRVLVALCRPYRNGRYAAPASNPEIAKELYLSVEAIRTTMRSLFAAFGIADLPQNQKRAALAEQALRTGVVRREEL